MSFTFSFASYFNQRFFQLYSGIKEIVSSNYDQRLFFNGKDEFYEISLVFNEMAEKLNKNRQKMSVTLQEDLAKNINPNDVEELKQILFRIKILEGQAAALISRLEKK
jgi:nitrate/nitrite-specific signal transduction histidine kinase